MTHHKPLIEINNVAKRVKNIELLAPLSYSLEKGKILALCGGNGAGKSTLIRIITGLIKPTSGTVTIDDITLKDNKRAYYEKFGYMPDDFQFQGSLTAKETLQFYARLKKIGQQRLLEVSDTVGLTEHLLKKVGNFSKGMRQRLLLAQALLAEPDILILDEPTNGLDPYWMQQFVHIMREARNLGQTIIFSTHELHIAEQIADEVIFLNEGKVISQGPMEQFADVGLQRTFEQLFFA